MIPHKEIWEAVDWMIRCYEVETLNLNKKLSDVPPTPELVDALINEVQIFSILVSERVNQITEQMHQLDGFDFQIRVKKPPSIRRKIERRAKTVYQWNGLFNDIIGIRFIFPCREEELAAKVNEFVGSWSPPDGMSVSPSPREQADGYRAHHLYVRAGGRHFPVEIQFWTRKDALINWYLHDTIYKELDGREGINEYAQELRKWMDAAPQPPLSIQTYTDYLYEKVAADILNTERS